MSVDLIRQNAPILRQAADQFTRGDVAGGKFSFALVHHDVKEGVYHTMWQMNGSPNVAKFGTNRFNDSNGLSSSSIEKAQVIYQYFQSKGLSPRENEYNVRELAGSNQLVYVNGHYVPHSIAGIEAAEGCGEGLRIVMDTCSENNLVERECCGKAILAGMLGFVAIVQIVDLIKVVQAYRS